MNILFTKSKKAYYSFVGLYVIITFTLSILSSGIFGVKMFTNRTNSMSPIITTKSLIFVAKSDNYAVGDIMSFYSRANQSEIMTHRVYKIGGNVYMTKGDANIVYDQQLVSPRQIIGKVVLILPYVGVFFTFLKSPIGVILFILTPATIIIIKELERMIHSYR